MRMLLANLLIRFTPCTVTIRSLETSLVWTWHENFLKWDLLAPVDMQIIMTAGNTLKLVKLDLRRQMHYSVKSLPLQKSSKVFGIK